MALSLKDKDTDRLAREVASLTGETLTDAIRRRRQNDWKACSRIVDPVFRGGLGDAAFGLTLPHLRSPLWQLRQCRTGG